MLFSSVLQNRVGQGFLPQLVEAVPVFRPVDDGMRGGRSELRPYVYEAGAKIRAGCLDWRGDLFAPFWYQRN